MSGRSPEKRNAARKRVSKTREKGLACYSVGKEMLSRDVIENERTRTRERDLCVGERDENEKKGSRRGFFGPSAREITTFLGRNFLAFYLPLIFGLQSANKQLARIKNF